nr:translation initiation factor 2 [Chroomonas debatzensis]
MLKTYKKLYIINQLRFLKSSFLQVNDFSTKLKVSNYKAESDFILELSNPVIIQGSNNRLISSRGLNEDTTKLDDPNETLLKIELNTKPSFKLDKKGKKLEKDDEKESDNIKAKIKSKKKLRAKVKLEEDYESLTSLEGERNTNDEVALLSLERPSKPVALKQNSITVTKQKKQPSTPTRKKKGGNSNKAAEATLLSKPEKISLSQPVTIQELSTLLVVPDTEIIKSLFFKGIVVTLNQRIDITTAKLVGEEFDIEINTELEEKETSVSKINLSEVDSSQLESRAPVIAVMGHVDHGKTTLLDKIRKTQTAQKESGGITQKLGAYDVTVEYKDQDRKLVFLDTPGHEAFSGMRSRGIKVTDIAILVVAADDGVRPQTIEAIKYIQASKVPLIVAINKIDKEEANIENIKQELTKYNLIPESWGGDTLMVPISSTQGTNIDTLLEMILLIADVEDLKANPNTRAEGTVIEAYIDRTKGAIATLLIQNGTLRLGDIIVAGNIMGKVRGIINSAGEKIDEAPPASPVLIWGFSKVPKTGENFFVCSDEKEARNIIQTIQEKSNVNPGTSQNINEIYSISDLDVKGKINLIIKTDIQGSVEAIVNTLQKISQPKVQIRILYASPGEVTETDIDFAYTSNALVLAFNTTIAPGVKKAEKNSGVIVKEFNVIYDLFDYVEDEIYAIVGIEYDEQYIGEGVVKSIFPLGKSFVAGSYIAEGKLTQACHIKVFRNETIVYEGELDSLKQVKTDVLEVREKSECGIFLKGFDAWVTGDIIKAFNLIEKKRK